MKTWILGASGAALFAAVTAVGVATGAPPPTSASSKPAPVLKVAPVRPDAPVTVPALSRNPRLEVDLPPLPPARPPAYSCADNPDVDGDGARSQMCGGTDCDDNDPGRAPGRPEVADRDHHDEDCDATTFGRRDLDADGYLDSRACNWNGAAWNCGDDCNDGDSRVHPNQPEVCNSVDDNCDGAIDDQGVQQRYFTDADHDGFGDETNFVNQCYPPAGTSALPGDCNDADQLSHPGQYEIANGIDDNCNGAVDEPPVISVTR